MFAVSLVHGASALATSMQRSFHTCLSPASIRHAVWCTSFCWLCFQGAALGIDSPHCDPGAVQERALSGMGLCQGLRAWLSRPGQLALQSWGLPLLCVLGLGWWSLASNMLLGRHLVADHCSSNGQTTHTLHALQLAPPRDTRSASDGQQQKPQFASRAKVIAGRQ